MTKQNTRIISAAGFIILSLLLIAACGENTAKSIVYQAEKLNYEAQKLMETASIQPDMANQEVLNQLKSAFKGVSDYCFEHIPELPREYYPRERAVLDSIAYASAENLAQIYFTEEKADSAVDIIRKFIQLVEPQGERYLNVRLSLARGYRMQGRLEDAIDVYRSLVQTFYPPVNQENEIMTRVLNIPMDLARTFDYIGNTEKADSAAKSAEEYYYGLMQKWPNKALQTAARSNLARLYYDMESWNDAISQLDQLTDSTGQVDFQAAMMIASINLEKKNEYRKALEQFDGLLARTDDTNIVPAIMMRKGQTYYEMGQYSKTREIMTSVADMYPSFYARNPLPQKYIAMSYEKMGRWVEAENEYQWLIDNYSTSEAAFDAHITIAEHYEDAGNSQLASLWFEKAENFYSRMAKRHTGTSVEASALSYLAEISRRNENWDKAAKYLEELFVKFSGTDIGKRSAITAAAVYRDKLNRPGRADSLLNLLKAELIPVSGGKNINIETDDNI